MNKNLLAATLVASITLTTSAFAKQSLLPFGLRAAVGAEVSVYNKTSFKSATEQYLNQFKTSDTETELAIQKNKSGFNLFANVKVTDFLGFELGYDRIGKITAAVQGNKDATVKISNFHFDLVGSLPVTPDIDFLAHVGVGSLKTKASFSSGAILQKDEVETSKVQPRVGAGAQYKFDDNWAARLMVRYQRGNNKFLKSVTSVSVGGSYTF